MAISEGWMRGRMRVGIVLLNYKEYHEYLFNIHALEVPESCGRCVGFTEPSASRGTYKRRTWRISSISITFTEMLIPKDVLEIKGHTFGKVGRALFGMGRM
jgi:hypothetical protein